ncbi:hypothetical protein GCM10011352_17810 [Marinobacterium zhoushanense]|uniref:Uncharacterized protein n=1 Tax=Marinobacterium zhoushanense TaxID=1679163 RepID=A0ABQ1K9U6_9GAMM|nr:hypothetical protein [Marinobacterium zhoushanense]GGB92191.1 hypothetical protein GCM10011352_17810 [Marinobacterium zhoushanense]
MSTMILHGRWYAIEGILAAAAAVLCVAILLPTENRFGDETLTDDAISTEQTRRGNRMTVDIPTELNTESRLALNGDRSGELRRVRAETEASKMSADIRTYSDGRNRIE